MRVLHVMEATIGGTRRHLTDLARGQARAGVDVHLAVSAERQPDFRDELASLAADGVGVLELPMVRAVRPLTDARHAAVLTEHVRSLAPDVVHTHSSKAGVLGRRASLAARAGARVHTPHTFAFLFEALFGPAKRALYRAVETHYGRRTDRMIAVSSSEAETIRASGVVALDRVRVVPNGLDPAPFEDARPAERPGDRPVAVVVGLLYEAKGQDLALEAVAAPECAGLELWLAGDGDRRGAYEERARSLGLGERARFLGWRDDVPSLLAAADFLILPSRWEGMPYVVLEAMAAGTPVVAARVDGVLDAVSEGETGFLCDVGDAADLARACGRMLALSPEERRAMGARGGAVVRERFTIDAMVRGTLGVYEEVVP